ncbi:GntR family transcriptional regulator [Salmonirosea aquatica]
MIGQTTNIRAGFLRIDERGGTPKFLQIANGIISQIEAGVFKPGDRLPSINEASTEHYMARATVEKAYGTLLKSGHITSLYRQGFFIAQGRALKRVLFLTGKINESNRTLFNAVSEQLGKGYKVDIYTYEYQHKYLLDSLENQAGHYHYFVLMAHHLFETDELRKVLNKIPTERLILLDDSSIVSSIKCASVRFGDSDQFRQVLEQTASLFRKYPVLNFITTDNQYIPAEWYNTFWSFTEKYGLKGRVMDAVDEVPLQKESAYLLFDDEDLVKTVQEVISKRWMLGQQVGVVSFNDASFKTIVGGGISVIKTDVSAIARNLSAIITRNQKQTVRIPMQFIPRGSL